MNYNTHKKTIAISLLIAGISTASYLLSSKYTDEKNAVMPTKHTKLNDNLTKSHNQVIKKVHVYKVKPEQIPEKQTDDTVKLKPRHLYVRNSTQIEQERTRRLKSQKRYLQMKKTREELMRRQRRQQHINKLKGNEDV